MPKWLRLYLMTWVAVVPPVLLLVGFAFFAAKYLNLWLGVIGLIIVVHLMFGWMYLCVKWEGWHD